MRSTNVSFASFKERSNSGLLRLISSIASFQYETSSLMLENAEGFCERLPSLISLIDCFNDWRVDLSASVAAPLLQHLIIYLELICFA